MRYRATHADRVTCQLRFDGWLPRHSYGCGCEPGRLCQQHSVIRATEHHHPEYTP